MWIRDVLLPQAWGPRYFKTLLVFFVIFAITTEVGVQLYTAPAILSPAPGIALALLTLSSTIYWPAIFLATIVVYSFTGVPLMIALLQGIAYALLAVTGSLLLKKLRFNPLLARVRDMLIFLLVAIIISPIVPTIGHVAWRLSNYFFATPLPTLTWGAWWTGVITSLFIVGAFTLRWWAEPTFTRTRSQWLEIAAIFILLTFITTLLFWTSHTRYHEISLVYFILAPLMWIALRFGSRFMTLALLVTTIIGISGTFFGTTAPSPENLGLRLLQIEIFLNIIATLFFILVSIEEERKNNANKLKTQIVQLEDAVGRLDIQDRAKSEFIAVLAHELRNPLTPIATSVELLRSKQLDEKESEHLFDVMDSRVKVIRRLLDDLLDVSRISRKKLILQREDIDLRPVIESAIETTKKYFDERNQSISVSLPDTPLVIHADSIRLEQVIMNLLSNASKFTQEGGKISVLSKQDGDTAIIRVADNGIGIEKDMLPRIFEPFLQAELGRHSREGLGIGLSLTRRLVDLQDGTISASSDGENRGSAFMIRFPLTKNQILTPLMDTQEAKRDEKNKKRKLKILIVDDNKEALEGITALVKIKTPHTVESASTGAEAKEKTVTFQPDIIVLDIGLPDMDGYEVARYLRSNSFSGKLIALTGYGQEEDKRKAEDAGFNHHLTKPITAHDLIALCEEEN